MEDIDPIVPGEAGASAESEPEKRRRQWRERKRKQRLEQREQKAAQTVEAESEWWTQNRASLSPTELAAMEEQDEYLRDVLFSMETINDVQSDPELVDVVVASVKEHGVTHLGGITRGDIPKDWSSRQYWKEPQLVAVLEQEGSQTAQFVRYGLLLALPDWRVAEFLQKKAGWSWDQVAELLGLTDSRDIVRYPAESAK
jgi:hypothetical protein